jgi:hypothetical protein
LKLAHEVALSVVASLIVISIHYCVSHFRRPLATSALQQVAITTVPEAMISAGGELNIRPPLQGVRAEGKIQTSTTASSQDADNEKVKTAQPQSDARVVTDARVVRTASPPLPPVKPSCLRQSVGSIERRSTEPKNNCQPAPPLPNRPRPSPPDSSAVAGAADIEPIAPDSNAQAEQDRPFIAPQPLRYGIELAANAGEFAVGTNNWLLSGAADMVTTFAR